MRCYTAELDHLRAPTMSRAVSLTPWSRVPHLMRRAMWFGSTRALRALGARLQAPQATRANDRQKEPTTTSDEELAREIFALPPYAPPPRDRLRVVHVIGSLSAGGAERQLVYLARESLRSGTVDARVMLTNPLVGTAAHYLPLAQDGGVTVEVAGATRDEATAAALAHDTDMQRRLLAVDPAYRPWVIELACEFVRLKPDVVHAWLDHANIWGAIAAFIAGVPVVVLSTRNVNPSNFPMIDAPYFLAWYRLLAGSDRVRFIGNSRVGAEDYADWMGVPRERFAVIPNGFDHAAMQPPDAAALAALRTELGVEARRVVLGVFRVAEEKEPLDFARAANEVLLSLIHI
jgi:glycosyltransferase involved in cell wall biosynthesis